jgi:ketosteroid isomerase-like protein
MNAHETLLEDFYAAFQHKDYATMIGCYHSDIHFSDPVFTDLQGNRAKAMWHMLCERGKDLRISFDNIQADDNTGQAHWDAAYTFSTGRRVYNVIDANFAFKDGKIIEHTDSFDLWRWTRMALGPIGWFLGWNARLHERVRGTAVTQLNNFIAQHPQYDDT